ncbi:MAG: RNA-binding protein [Firmicutes bacterium]|nr:RNA-binding protein [Bacillota bacterium]
MTGENKDDRLLLAQLEDKIAECSNGIFAHTAFLDSRQCALAASHCRSLGSFPLLWGGYDDAERRTAMFLPDYMSEEEAKSDEGPLALLRVSVPKGSPALTHRDYLGSLMSLGIKREVAGDIIVREGGCDIIILKEMGSYLLQEYSRAGRASLSPGLAPLSSLVLSEQRTEEITDSVASVRLDAVCASAFRLSRGKAQEAVHKGLVSVNGLQCLKPDYQPAEGDRIVLRGKGKAVLSSVGGTSRKGRLYIVIKKYI